MRMTYKIVRYQFYGEPEVVQRGLTLEEARKHCSDPKSEGIDWFDGYTKEIGVMETHSFEDNSFEDKYRKIVDIVERGGDHRTMRCVLESLCDTNVLTQYEAFEIDLKYKQEKEID